MSIEESAQRKEKKKGRQEEERATRYREVRGRQRRRQREGQGEKAAATGIRQADIHMYEVRLAGDHIWRLQVQGAATGAHVYICMCRYIAMLYECYIYGKYMVQNR